MKLSDAQLSELRARCIKADSRGYLIGQVEKYVKTLAEETGATEVPSDVKVGSPAHLLGLVQDTIDQRAGKKSKPKPKAAKVVEAPKPEKVEVAVAVEVKAKPKTEKKSKKSKSAPEVPPYEEWNFDELYKESQARDISGRSTMTKDELVAAMYEDDANA